MTEKRRLEIARAALKRASEEEESGIREYWREYYKGASNFRLKAMRKEIAGAQAVTRAAYELLSALDLVPEEYTIPF